MGAAIDIGSNSIHLLVALVGPGFVQPLRDTSELLGLGDVVDSHGRVPPNERSRVIEILKEYQETARRCDAERLVLLGTEPLRRAQNADEFADEIEAATGITPRVLKERDEAVLTFMGVTQGELPDQPLIVVDIGGGSTEALTYVPGQDIYVDHIPTGSSRLTNAIVQHDPPTRDEIRQLLAAADDATAGLAYRGPDGNAETRGLRAVFVGGTATNVARLGRLTRAALAEDLRTLERMTTDAVVRRFSVKPRRARQLAAGVAIVDLLLRRYGLSAAEVSDASLRDGAIITAARHGEGWFEALGDVA